MPGSGIGGSPLPIVGSATPVGDSTIDAQGQWYKNDKTNSVSRYARSEGLFAIPVSGPVGTPPKIVRLYAPMGVRQYDFNEQKDGFPPIMPQVSDSQSGDTLVSADFSVAATMIGSQQGYSYVGYGIYTFIQAQWPFSVPVQNTSVSVQYPGLRGDPGIAVQASDFPFSTLADNLLVNASFFNGGPTDQVISYPYDYTLIEPADGYWPSKDFPPNAFTADIIH